MLLKQWDEYQPSRVRNRVCLCLVVALCCAIYAGILATAGMAPTEGWYSYYAYIINEEGAVPYLNFELLFPPLYTYLIALFTRVFGYSVMALRVLGVVVYSLTGVFACLIFEKLTKRPIFSLLAGLLSAAILQSESVQIFYDYIRFMDLAVYAAVYFFLCAVERIEKENRLRFFEPTLLLGACFATLASMFKQSSGLIFLLYCCIFFVFAGIVLPKRRLYWKALAASLSVAALLYGLMILFLWSQGSLSAYAYYNFSGAIAAKGGSLFAVLFGWLLRSGAQGLVGLLGVALLACMGGLLFLCRYLSRRVPATEEDKPVRPALLWSVLGGGVAVLMLVASIFYERLSGILVGSYQMFTAFLVSTVVFAIVSVWMIIGRVKKKELPFNPAQICFFSGTVFILGYSVCTSGGLVESQVALGYPLVAMLFLPVLGFRKREWVALGLAIVMLFNTGIGWERKMRHIYNWWGLDVGSIAEMTEPVDLPLMKGIRASRPYAVMYEGVVEAVEEHSAEDEEIFVFPHMPIFYLLCDRPRATNTAIQWFDVSTDAAVRADIEVLREKKPKVMVVCMIDDYVISSHESSFRQGQKSGLHEMQDFLEEFLREEPYVLDRAYPISSGYTVEVWYLS